MNTRTNNSVSIKVNNFGPISEAKVDLRPLTVLVGDSNTGKSYFASVVYALLRTLKYSFIDLNPTTHGVSIPEFENLMQETAERLHSQLSQKDPKEFELGDKFHEYLSTVYNKKLSTLPRELVRCLGVEDVSFLTLIHQQNLAKIKLKTSAMYRENLESHSIELSTKPKHNYSFPRSLPLPQEPIELAKLIQFTNNFKQNPTTPQSSENELTFKVYKFFRILFDTLVSPYEESFCSQVIYLPASRTGIMNTYNTLVKSSINLTPRDFVRKSAEQATMTGIIADLLVHLTHIDPDYSKNKQLGGFEKGIEKTILKGRINIDTTEDIKIPIFSYQPEGWNEGMPLASASSMVSELAPIVLFLRTEIKPGMLLIIEEPESHLHPAMQVKLTNQIAKLVNEGIRVVVTTHSEWVIEALSNIVHRSKIAKEFNENTSSNKIALKEDQVGVWYFKNNRRKKGTVVKEIKLGKSITGQYPTGYDRVAINLHNEWVGIANIVENS